MLTRQRAVRAFLLGLWLATACLAQPATEKVLIRAAKPYTALVEAIESRGGRVTREFRYVNAIAAEIPLGALDAIGALAGGALTKDLVIPQPAPVDPLRGRNLAPAADQGSIAFRAAEALSAAGVASLATANPNGYIVNNAIANASPLHAQGILGQGVVVAVIDSGIRPGFPHISLDGSVIGCEDFVGDALGCSNFANSGHGTFVAGMVSAAVVLGFDPASVFRNAVLAECPACFIDPPDYSLMPMIGSAPFSSIYALRVFGPTGGSPTSRTLAAIERVIELRERFDAGHSGGVNIQVVNMSLGGPTLFAGRDLFDQTVDLLVARGIVPVTSAGNAGPATMTTGSPASAIGALTVGAASLPHNERIFWRLVLGPMAGALFRPFPGIQTAYFSSRGPHADGRPDPDVVSSGFGCFGQGTGPTTGTISIGSGTSFSAPTVAGVAALLRQAFPNATARQIRNAIAMSANPNLITDGSGPLDRGAGYVNALGAANLLAAGGVPDTLPHSGIANRNVAVNVRLGAGLRPQTGLVRERVAGLKPGQRHDILYQVQPNTSQVVVVLGSVTPSLPPAEQNQLFGDDVLLGIHTAKTSAIGEGDYAVFAATSGGTFSVNDPEPGIMRISVNGDWTNAGSVSAEVTVFSLTQPIPRFTRQGRIATNQAIAIPIEVTPGIGRADFRLAWSQDWGSFPTNDLDLILLSPTGEVNFDGATLDSPESVTIQKPAAGTWMALIVGFELHDGTDRFEFRAALDGKVVR